MWSVVLIDHSPARRRRKRYVKKLVNRLAPVLREIESQGGDPAGMVRNARSVVARVAVPDWDGLDVLRCRRPETETIGGVRIRVAASYGGPVGSIDQLIEDVRERIAKKTFERAVGHVFRTKVVGDRTRQRTGVDAARASVRLGR